MNGSPRGWREGERSRKGKERSGPVGKQGEGKKKNFGKATLMGELGREEKEPKEHIFVEGKENQDRNCGWKGGGVLNTQLEAEGKKI